MTNILQEKDDVQFSEPIQAQKGVRMGIAFVEKSEWEVKEKSKWTSEGLQSMQPHVGKKFPAVKVTLQISDDSVATEHEGATPRMTVEDQFNIVRFPYPDKNTGELKWLGRQKLYQLEEAFGFDPVYEVGGRQVEPFITRTGRKAPPKIDGVQRTLNPDFFNAYFEEDGTPKVDNWIGKTVFADIGLVKSEQFGDKNEIQRYVKPAEV